jgi:hypothetical protein
VRYRGQAAAVEKKLIGVLKAVVRPRVARELLHKQASVQAPASLPRLCTASKGAREGALWSAARVISVSSQQSTNISETGAGGGNGTAENARRHRF